MSRREDIDNSIWDDQDFAGLDAPAKLLYLWSFTNARCGMGGIYKVTRDAIALDTGLEEVDVDDALEQLADRRFAFHADGVLWVRARVKHLRSKGPGVAKAIAGDVGRVRRDHPLRARFVETYGSHPWPGGLLGELLAALDDEDAGTVPETVPETVGGTVPGTVGGTVPGRVSETLIQSQNRDRLETVPGTVQGNGNGNGIGKRGVGGSGGKRGPRTVPDVPRSAQPGHVPAEAEFGRSLGIGENSALLAAWQVRSKGAPLSRRTVAEYVANRPETFEAADVETAKAALAEGLE